MLQKQEAEKIANIAMWQSLAVPHHSPVITISDLLTEDLSHRNFFQYAIRHYTNNNCTSQKEFNDDLNTITHVKKLLKRYVAGEELKTRLILNHLTLFFNVFSPPQAATRMLAFRMSSLLSQLKPFLLCLGYWADEIQSINGKTIISSDISLDSGVVAALRSEFKELRL